MWLSFLRKQKTPSHTVNYSFLAADMHSHILPGLDDGAATLEDALNLIDGLRQLGYRKLIASPHISMEFYPNTVQKIERALNTVNEAVREKGWAVEIEAAAEYMIDDWFLDLLAKGQPLLTFGSDRSVLIEMGYVAEHPMIRDAIFQLLAQGYKPVLAHPERYNFYHHHPEEIGQLVDLGCKLQLNILALTGHYGQPVRKMAELILNNKWYTLAGTDLHHQRHALALSSLSNEQFSLLSQYAFENYKL